MPASEILLHHARTGAPVRLAGADSVVLSSADSGWSGIALEQQHLPPTDTPHGYMPWHLLSVQLRPPPLFEDHRGGVVERVRLRPGDIVFRPAGVPGRAAWTGSSETLNVVLDPDAVRDVAAHAGVAGAAPERSRFGPDPVVHDLVACLRRELADGCPGGPLFADGVRTTLAAHVCARYGEARLPAGPRRLSAAELARVDARIHDDLAGDLRLADLAAAVPLSPFHFSRVFRATTGLTPHRYVMRCRLQAARELLERGTLGLDEVARRTGFADRGHLARQVRRRYGVTPGRLRAEARR